jgi:hypothetical protein
MARLINLSPRRSAILWMSIRRSQKSLHTFEKLQSARSVAVSDHVTLESYVHIVVRILMARCSKDWSSPRYTQIPTWAGTEAQLHDGATYWFRYSAHPSCPDFKFHKRPRSRSSSQSPALYYILSSGLRSLQFQLRLVIGLFQKWDSALHMLQQWSKITIVPALVQQTLGALIGDEVGNNNSLARQGSKFWNKNPGSVLLIKCSFHCVVRQV